jgi:hypothetical protein
MIDPKTPAITIATTPPMMYAVVRLEPDGGGCVGEVEGLVDIVGEGDTVGLGDGVGEVLGVGTGVGVGVAAGNATKLAVIFPGPFTVAVVEPVFEFPNVMLAVSADHEENL